MIELSKNFILICSFCINGTNTWLFGDYLLSCKLRHVKLIDMKSNYLSVGGISSCNPFTSFSCITFILFESTVCTSNNVPVEPDVFPIIGAWGIQWKMLLAFITSQIIILLR